MAPEIESAEWYNAVVCEALGYEKLQPWQLITIMHACAGGDNFIVAPTGAGKSTVMQGAVLADRARGVQSIAITLVPTKSLADDQARATNRIKHLKALALHGDSVVAANCQLPPRNLFSEIRKGEYTHIYLGPEMIMNGMFGEILADDTFYEQFRYFTIDEAHMLVEWSSFRNSFADIRRLRNRFKRKITWTAVSATVEPTQEFPVLMDAFGFQTRTTKVTCLPVDRGSIVYLPRFLSHAASKTGLEFLDFCFVIPLSAKTIEDIPVTVIFVSEIRQADALAAYLTSLLPESIEEPTRSRVVLPMHSVTSATHNVGAVESIRVGDSTRILVCTDTGALGIDVKRVGQVVVLVDTITKYRMVCQKIGRIRNQGRAILLFPRWMDANRSSASDTNMRANMEPVMVAFANSTKEQCPRTVNKAYWQDEGGETGSDVNPCCNRHNPELDSKDLEEVKTRAEHANIKKRRQITQLRSDRTHAPPDSVVVQPIVRKLIKGWRQSHLQKSKAYKPHLPASVILPDHLVELLAEKLHICTTLDRFQEVMSSWTHLEEWGTSLFNFVIELWATIETDTVAQDLSSVQAQRKEHKTKRAADDEGRETEATNHVAVELPTHSLQPNTSKRGRTLKRSTLANKNKRKKGSN